MWQKIGALDIHSIEWCKDWSHRLLLPCLLILQYNQCHIKWVPVSLIFNARGSQITCYQESQSKTVSWHYIKKATFQRQLLQILLPFRSIDDTWQTSMLFYQNNSLLGTKWLVNQHNKCSKWVITGEIKGIQNTWEIGEILQSLYKHSIRVQWTITYTVRDDIRGLIL